VLLINLCFGLLECFMLGAAEFQRSALSFATLRFNFAGIGLI
jgi:hypothetical protein